MRWVGVDLHRRRWIAIIDEHGDLRSPGGSCRRPRHVPGAARRSQRDARGDWRRPTAGSGSPSCSGGRLRRAPRALPLRTRAIAAARVKTPTRSTPKRSRTCCAPGFCPRRTSPRRRLRDLRELLRHRARADPDRTAVRTACTRCSPARGILPEHYLFGKSGRGVPRGPGAAGRLAGVGQPDGADRGDFDREITATTREIDARAKADERVKVLCQIRGVGRLGDAPGIAEVGDVSRFPTARHLCAWRARAERAQLRRQSAPRSHLPPGLPGAAVGAHRGWRRRSPPAAGRWRAMFQRIASAAGATSPRSPWPASPSSSATTARGTARSAPHSTNPPTTTRNWPRPHDPRQPTPHSRSRPGRRGACSGELAPMSGLFTRDEQGRPRTRIEPPTPARHPGPPARPDGCLELLQAPATPKAKRRPTPRAP